MENEIKDSICTQKLPISGSIWCDDQTDVYVGRCEKLSAKAIASQNHPTFTRFETTATCCDYLYFVCWSNDWGINGFLAEINGILTNGTDWEVFATGINYNSSSPRPPQSQVLEQIEKANCHHYWKRPTEGPKNKPAANNPFPNIPSISANANFIWYDSGLDTTPGTPFKGFNHDEFLIFRLSVKKIYRECDVCECEDCHCCDCGCDGCNEKAGEQEAVLGKRAKGKQFIIPGSANAALCTRPYTPTKCTQALSSKKLNLCFHLHWGDGPTDQIESTDTEVLYLTVCNPYADLKFRGLRITKLTIIPTQPLAQMQLVPDSFLCFDCLDPCSCKSRELALLTKNVPPGSYSIEVEYCVDEVEVTSYVGGKTTFPIKVIQD